MCRGIRSNEFGMFLLQLRKLIEKAVVLGIGDLRIIQHVIKMVVIIYLLS